MLVSILLVYIMFMSLPYRITITLQQHFPTWHTFLYYDMLYDMGVTFIKTQFYAFKNFQCEQSLLINSWSGQIYSFLI